MKKQKIGMIGCGYFTHFHLDNLLEVEDVEVTAFAAPNREKLELLGKRVSGARLYGSHREMFEAEEDLDAVFIIVPPDSHEDAEILAARRGIAMYVEKPMALSMEKALEVEREIAKAGVITSVGFQERYLDIALQARDYLSSDEAGLACASWIDGIPGPSWWRRKDRSGGQVVEQSIHLFDLLRYFLGEAESVYSTAIKGIVKDLPGYDIEDASSTTVKFRNNVIATILTGCYLSDTAPASVSVRVHCRNATVDYGFGREMSILRQNHSEHFVSSQKPHRLAVQAFLEALRKNDPSSIRSSYADAVKTLRLTLAANESMQSGLPVRIAE